MDKLILLAQFLTIFVFIASIGTIYLKLTKSKFSASTIYIFTIFGVVVGATTAELCFTFLGEDFYFSHNFQFYLVGSFISIVTLVVSFYTLRWKLYKVNITSC